ncbi:hypothetical protein [Azospirillum sp. TSO22-1]|uniref:hypothetical protein n=1 Tax=Azospirillum sp. TSO22-1 TaxID=716789 RepID=UPI0011B85976|nr:hypothetical protein [Azospirillum sp. TSO22-1]
MTAVPDVIVAVLPDGAHRVVKGRAELERIIASGRAERHRVEFVNVASDAEADELLRRHGSH